MTIELTVAVSLACTLIGVVATLAAKKRSERQEAQAEGKADGAMLTELAYIKSGIDDIKRRMDTQEQRYVDIMTRLATVESSAKQAHKRIDGLSGTTGRD